MSRRIIQAGVKPRAKVYRRNQIDAPIAGPSASGPSTTGLSSQPLPSEPAVDDIPNFDFGDPANAHLLPGHARKRAKTRLAGSTQADL
ncbi:uncharacterized protein B0H18DRAFT_1124185 [Fomitopsis serialis]|uniref:uncharacterized protein n=1 Tax=Fomitopsis serialis TaxID=139415 RepID=UPI00200740A5|nr:uncharacterized protein B0H18DRAFT_1124185 [Neoantrodia serialis]KAH9916548.1 hypothetical protein B0H18DRAFT_1124185 [Neoantrodia serialis]